MIYIEANLEGEVGYRNYDIATLGKTETELLKTGYLVETIPKPEVLVGKDAFLFINPITKELYYNYKNRKLTPSEEIILLKDENKSLKSTVVSMADAITFLMDLQMIE